MPLQTQGIIGMKDLATEFKQPVTNVRLGNYYKNGSIVQDTLQNITVPSEGPIGLKDFYGAAFYAGKINIYGQGESVTQYANANDSKIFVAVEDITSPVFRITVGGSITNVINKGENKTYSFFMGSQTGNGSTYTVSYTDCKGTWTYQITLGYGSWSGGTDGIVDLTYIPPDNPNLRILNIA